MSREPAASFRWWSAGLLLGVCVIWVLLSQVPLVPTRHGSIVLGPDGALDFLERKTLDARFALRGPLPTPVPVIYVNVDFEAIEQIGNFPWNREVFARTLDVLFEHGKIHSAGLDFVFSPAGIPQEGHAKAEEGNTAFGRSIKRHTNVVLAAAFAPADETSGGFPYVFEKQDPARLSLPEMPVFPLVGPTWGHIGLINTFGDGAAIVPFFAQTKGHSYFPLSLELALLGWDLDESAVSIERSRLIVRDPNGTPRAEVPLVLGQFVEPNWFTAWHQNPSASIVQVLVAGRYAETGTDAEKAEAAAFFEPFRDAVVLIGPTDPQLKDVSVLPLSGPAPVPRVSLHGNLLQMLVSGRFLKRPPVWVNVLLIVGLGFAAGAFSLVSDRWSRKGKLLAVALVPVYLVISWLAFARWDLVLPVVAPLGAVGSCGFVAVVLQLSRERRQKRRIRELFGTYVSAAVVAEMIEKDIPPTTGGVEVEITAFFSDIVAFSSIAETLPATELVAMMSEYLTEGTAAVMDAGGTLDKYVGDAIVSIFGAPLHCADHAAAACRAAIGLQAGQARLRERWGADPGRWPEEVRSMRSRVGLHTGSAVVGNIGSQLRFNYTMMGDTVNLAQRLEAAAAHFRVGILVSGPTREEASRDDAELVFRALDRVLVPGRSQPVDVFELLGRGAAVREAALPRLEAYAAAREIYRSGNWSAAQAAFQEAATFEPGNFNPALAMAARCQNLSGSVPVVDLVFSLEK